MNRARIIDISRTSTHTSKIRCSIPRTSDARPTHESLTECVQTHTLRERFAYKHFRSAIVSGMNVIRARFMRDMNVGRQWTDMDVCGFEPVPTHKHRQPTRVPRIVAHTRRINFARRLMNYARRVRRKNFEPFKTRNHAQTAFNAYPLTITDNLRSFHRRITHTTHAPRRNENLCVICVRLISRCDWPFSNRFIDIYKYNGLF
jgi:hypothetical protein